MSECVVRMEMPKHCGECKVNYGCAFCGITGSAFYGNTEIPNFRPDEQKLPDCPIICALPEGHGRLVDKDLLMQDLDFLNTFDTPDGKELSYEDILVTIDDFPTIVPAERSET